MGTDCELDLLFKSCEQHLNLELLLTENKILGYNKIIIANSEIPDTISFQVPSISYCVVTSVEINNLSIENWTLFPVPSIEDADKIVGNNVYDALTFQMAHSYISSSYGNKNMDKSAFFENKLIIPIPYEYKLKKGTRVGFEIDETEMHHIEVIIKFEISLLVSKSPILYTCEDDNFIYVSIIPQKQSKYTWFPTLPCYSYLSERPSPFWNSSWKFTCKVPDGYFALMPGKLDNIETVEMLGTTKDEYFKVYDYSYNSGTSFPHLYPNNVTLFIGKYSCDVTYLTKSQICIYRPINSELKTGFQKFITEVIAEYEKILDNILPFQSISIILLDFLVLGDNRKYLFGSTGISDTLDNVDCTLMLSKPILDSERYFYSHLNEADVGATMGNIIMLPSDMFKSHENEMNYLLQLLNQSEADIKNESVRFIAEMNLRTLLILLDRIACLWFGSFIHVVSTQRLSSDGWLLLGMKRYLIRQLTKKLFGDDFVRCKMKEALERCVMLIEMGNDYIPLSVRDFQIPFCQDDPQGCPLINWSQRENQSIYRLKSDLVFYSLEFYVDYIIKGKSKKVGFGPSDINSSLKNCNPHSKFFNSFIRSFIIKYCAKKNSRYFTTQHFFIHLSSCISQQFIHRSKREIASAQIPQHEQYLLNEIQDELIAFRSAWIEGVGCPSLTFSTAIHLSNKSFDDIAFLVDQTPLQPPHLTSKEGISSFIPLIATFKSDLNSFKSNNLFDKNLSYLYKYFNSKYFNEIGDEEATQRLVHKLIPSFLWPQDPNNIVMSESNNILLGLGYADRLNIPLKCGIGPLFQFVSHFNDEKTSQNEDIETKDTDNSTVNNSSYSANPIFFNNISKSSVTNNYISCSGSCNTWQLGYINVLCNIFLNNYKSTQKKDSLEWLCSEIISNVPISSGSGRFWPGYTNVSIIQNEKAECFDLEIIEPQLPIIQEFKVDFTKARTGNKRDVVSSNSATVSTQNNLSSSSNSKSSSLKTSEVPRLSLLQDLQQRKCFVGKLSLSDRFLFDKALNSNIIDDFGNKELTEKSFSDSHNINLLWILTDISQYWIARIYRYQTWSMWDQQLMNETNIIGQLEAATQLGMENYFFKESNKTVLMQRLLYSLDLLMNSLYHFDWNTSVRKRSLISIVKIFNKISCQKLLQVGINNIKTLIFSFIKKFIFDIKTIINYIILGDLKNIPIGFFIEKEQEMLFFSVNSLALFWDLDTNSTCYESLYLLSELLERETSELSTSFKFEFLFAILKSIENSTFQSLDNINNVPIEKISLFINDYISKIINSEFFFSDFTSIRTCGLIFRIISKHQSIFNSVANKFRDKFGTYFNPLLFVNIPFTENNSWWKNYSVNEIFEKPLYLFLNNPILEIQALRCYFCLSLQGYCDTLTVFISEETHEILKFIQISPKIVYRQILDTFEFNSCLQKTNGNVVNDLIDEYTNLKLGGLFSVWRPTTKHRNNSFLSKEFPKNLLKTLSVCVIIHTKLCNSIEKTLLSGAVNSNKLKVLNMLWSSLVDAFDTLIQSQPYLFNEFVKIQSYAEFLPLINNISSTSGIEYLDEFEDIRQCSLFISQIILNTPISLSSYPFDPYIFENILNIYVSLFGHGVPACLSFPPYVSSGSNSNELSFDENGYIVCRTPEIPIKEGVRKRQKLLKRGFSLSDLAQIKRLCSDENYVISRGWKHMCKKITQYLIDSPYGTPFIHPVNENDAPEYYNLICKPTDLSTIMNKIKSDMYESIECYRSDMELIFDNCKKYNEPSSMIVSWCNKLQAEFETLSNPVFKYFTGNNSF